MTVICQLREAGWLVFVRYMRQDDGKLPYTSGSCLAVICQLMIQDYGYLTATSCSMTVICKIHQVV
jgi:hypothetical protein